MKAPKILPWIASKAGISEELALNLWRRAASEAEALTACCTRSDYYRLTVEHFIDLAEEESEKYANSDPLTGTLSIPRFNWMRRYQERIWLGNLLSAQNTYRLWLTSWTSMITGHKQSA
ncbi:hypothetical protein [Propionivibrio sp.]|uniref:hypothetical protein n=1 Tax=Propionivibrio sp. TaxID=2212460 RepID=UPI00262327E1|nr:hypothetical protein [Propionivibrio sp.]